MVKCFIIFRCVARAHIPDQKKAKLDDKNRKTFLDVNDEFKAWRLHDLPTKIVIISISVTF